MPLSSCTVVVVYRLHGHALRSRHDACSKGLDRNGSGHMQDMDGHLSGPAIILSSPFLPFPLARQQKPTSQRASNTRIRHGMAPNLY